jgi:cytosine/adenosine deaminase-related metal-dependent hydrolase
MSYRKFIADHLFTGNSMLDENSVLITDEEGIVTDIVHINEAGEGIERFNGILSPGFINCHCHLELSHMKGMIPPKTGMIKFLLSVMNSRNLTEEEIHDAIRIAEQYMWERGIVAVGDICNTTHTISSKAASDMYYHNFTEAIGFIESTAEARFEYAFGVYSKFRTINKRSGHSMVPHAPYSVSNKLFSLLNDFDLQNILSIHNQESEDETEFFASGQGGMKELYRELKIDVSHFKGSDENSLLQFLKKTSSSHSLLLVHNVHTTKNDLEWIRERKNLPELFWCLCPNANIYINDRLPDVKMLKENNCKIVVGTDSLASNYQLNILEEIKTLQDNFPFLTTLELLQWATLNGAEALRIQDHYGSLEKGKKPGLVNIDAGIGGKLAATVAKKIL